LEICKRIWGEDFYGRVAFITTMWDMVKETEFEIYNRLYMELDRRCLRLLEHGPELFRYFNDEQSCRAVVMYFSELAKSSRKAAELLLFKEISSGFRVRKTTAGREIIQKPNRERDCIVQ